MAGGNVGEGVVVDLNGIAERPLEIDPVRRTARTGAQVTLAELNTAAGAHGLRLPPDPSSGGWATVGGVISTNASGPRTMKYGSVRPWVRSVEMVLASGERIELRRGEGTGRGPVLPAPLQTTSATLWAAVNAGAGAVHARFPKVRKNSTGYALDKYLESGDLLDLVIGAEGTLGIVTAATWRLDALPTHRSALRLTLRHLEDLGELVPMLVAQGASAAELLDRTFLQMVRDTPAARALGLTGREEGAVLVEFEGGSEEEVRELATRTSELGLQRGAEAHLALSTEAMDALIKLRKSASPILAALPGRRSLQIIEDGCVPVERLGEYVTAIRRSAGERGVEVVIFGHAGDGNVHVNSMADLSQPHWAERLRGVYGDAVDAIIALGGVPSGEHGDGRLRAGVLERVYGAEVMALFRRVKESFDPAGVLNPGIKLGPVDDPIQRLKIGPDAVTIPADIEQGLREIEMTGGYARDRLELAGPV